ncbi:MAG: DUF488 domain-containing protein [Candidatus Methanomethylicia archaeon]
MEIYTLGHSTRDFDEFLDILIKFNIEIVIDVRRFPTSGKFPWFSKDNLSSKLGEVGIIYHHFPELGGYRREGYGEFAKTDDFKSFVAKMLNLIDDKRSVILCSERFWFRCHRRYIANYLAELGYRVIHIYDVGRVEEHKLRSKDIEEKMKLVVWCDKRARKMNI